MADFIVKAACDEGLSVKLYRGEDMVLLAFDITEALRTSDFVGFGVQYRVGAIAKWRDVYNLLTFKGLREKAEAQFAADRVRDPNARAPYDHLASMRSPFQKFRWAHVPSMPLDADVEYRVSALYWNGGGDLIAKATVSATLDLRSVTRPGFLDVGFTRGFASSQAYGRRFKNRSDILPARGHREIDFDPKPFEADDGPYPWMGFEARRLQLGFLESYAADPDIRLDVYAYDLSNPEVLDRLKAYGDRLRIVIDNSDKHGLKDSNETAAETELKKTAGEANVARHHFQGLQHNKVLIAKRRTAAGFDPVAVLTGSTNFSLRGLYIQNNNVLVFTDPDIAGWYLDAFEAGFPSGSGYDRAPPALKWFEKTAPGAGLYRFCYSPHADSALSMGPIAQAIGAARKSVFYAIAFRGAETGPVDKSLDRIDPQRLVVMGVSDMPGKGGEGMVKVQAPGRGPVPLRPAALAKNAPAPFHAEWAGGNGIRMHHKFVICDFNGDDPVVFTGSSNLADGGETGNGDNLIEIRDPKVVTAYMVQAVSIFDHFLFRVRRDRPRAGQTMDLAEPPAKAADAWWWSAFQDGSDACRDRLLFAG